MLSINVEKNGDELLRENKFVEAEDFFEKALASNPSNARNYYNYGLALIAQSKWVEGLLAFDEAVRLNPNDEEARLEKALILQKLNDQEAAEKCFKDILHELSTKLSSQPKNPKYNSLKGKTLLACNQFEEALNCFNVALALEPKEADHHYRKGRVLYKLGRYKEALECLRTAVSLNPKEARYLQFKGIVLCRCDKYKAAATSLAKSEKINSKNADLHQYLGYMWRFLFRDPKREYVMSDITEMQCYEKALASFEEALRLDPFNPENYMGKAMALRLNKRYQEALDCVQIARVIFQNDKHIQEPFSKILKQAEKDKVKLDMNVIAVAAQKAEVYVAKMKTDLIDSKISVCFKRAKRYEELKQTIVALHWLGKALDNAGDLDKEAVLKKAGVPEVEVKTYLSTILVKQGKLEALKLMIDTLNPTTKFYNGNTLLHIAAEEEQVLIMEVLISKGYPQIENDEKETPLLIVARRGNVLATSVLLKGGAIINHATPAGLTALYCASQNGHFETVNLLLKEGADLSIKFNGLTSLDIAKQNKHPEIVELLDQHQSYLSFMVSSQDFTLGQELGRGGFGVVYKGTWRQKPVAIKQLLNVVLTDNVFKDFQNEINIMLNLRSRYIIELKGICLENNALLMEYASRGSLGALLKSNETFSWKIRIQWAKEIGKGLVYLHSENILHRDLKSPNVLITDMMHAKIADFGISRIKKDDASSIVTRTLEGSTHWIAPELEFEKPRRYNEKTDTYSLGVVIWEIATRKQPFENAATRWEVLDKLKNDRQGEFEKLPADTPEVFKTTIAWCWKMQKDKRPTAMEALKNINQNINEQINTDEKCRVM